MAPYYDKQGNEVFFTYSIDAMEAAQFGDVTGLKPGEKKAAKPAPETNSASELLKGEPSEESPKQAPLRRGEGS